MQDGGVEPRAVRPGRSWPHAAALVLFVVVLGLLPHVRFSLLVGEPMYFFSAYDEEQYSFWALGGGGPHLPHRWLSSAALALLSKLSGGSWNLALMLADVVFPAACAVLAWILVGHLTRRPLLRLLLALGLLFAQELFSLGCWTIWQSGDVLGVTTAESRVYDLRYLREIAPPWLLSLWPDYTSPFLTQFRTPEPQISRVVLFAILAALLATCRASPGQRPSRAARDPRTAAQRGAARHLPIPGRGHRRPRGAPEPRPARVSEVEPRPDRRGLCGGRRRRRSSWERWPTRATANALGLSFTSRLPVVAPSVIGAVAGLVLLATVLRRSRGRDLYPLAAACFGTVLVLTNQQVLTGRMVLTSTWERYVDYPLVFLGAAIVAAWLLRGAGVALPALYAVAGAALVLVGSVLLTAQDRLFQHEYLVANLESVAMRRAVEAVEARGVREATWLLTDPGRSLMLEVRLERRIDHLLDVTSLFRRPVDPLVKPDGASGLRSPYTREVFEYMARRPRTPAALARQLKQESEGGVGDVLRFLFDYRDFWAPMTDGRRTRSADVKAEIPEIGDAFARYLETGDPCWFRPVVVLTRQAAVDRVSERWDETFLVEATVGRDRPIMNMNAYLQTLSARNASGRGAVAPGDCASERAAAP